MGNGTTKAILDNDEILDTDNTTVEIPKEPLIYTTDDKIKALVESTYPDKSTTHLIILFFLYIFYRFKLLVLNMSKLYHRSFNFCAFLSKSSN
jgi:hypothetical protein